MAGIAPTSMVPTLPAQGVTIDPSTGLPVGVVPGGNGIGVAPAPTDPQVAQAVAAQQQAQAVAAQQQLAQQQQAQAVAQAQAAAAEVQGVDPALAAQQQALAVQAAQSPATQAAPVVPTAPAPAPTGTGVGAAPAVAGAPAADPDSATLAKRARHGSELWSGTHDPRKVHVTQVRSKYNPTPASGNRDCGPASVVMALRMLGVALPGVSAKAGGEAAIDRVRALAGQSTHTSSTTNLDLEHAIAKTGAHTREVMDFASVKAAVMAGQPVILNGNPHNPGAYGTHFTASQMVPFDGAHWVTVSGWDEATGEFIVNDPLSMVGPVKVTPAMLDAYRGGSMGIVVSN